MRQFKDFSLVRGVSTPPNTIRVFGVDLDYPLSYNIGVVYLINSTPKFQTHNPENLLILKILVQTKEFH